MLKPFSWLGGSSAAGGVGGIDLRDLIAGRLVAVFDGALVATLPSVSATAKSENSNMVWLNPRPNGKAGLTSWMLYYVSSRGWENALIQEAEDSGN